MIATLVPLLAAARWPNPVRPANDPDRSLTIWGAASSPPTLSRMLVIAAIGVPRFLTYSAMMYWVFSNSVPKQRRQGGSNVD